MCRCNLEEKHVVAGKAKNKYRACLDHDHQTGAIRAVLCNNCNGIEGKVFNLANRAKRNRTVLLFVADLVKYWYLHRKNRTGLLHPEHMTSEERRLDRNRKERQRRAKSKAKR